MGMEKQAVIDEEHTPVEEAQVKKAAETAKPDLDEHFTKRAAEAAQRK